MKTKCRRIMSIFVVSLLVLTSVCTGFSVSAAGEEKVTYEYFVDCDDVINAFEGEVAFPDGLSVDSIKIHDSIQNGSDPFYTVKNNKIVFLATIVGDDETVDFFNFSDGKALISVDFIVNGEYDKKDITTTLTEFYSTKVIYEGNIPFEYENQVNNEVISSGHVDLDNPSDSHANPIVTFVDGDNVTTEIVEYNTAVSKPTDPTKDGYDFLGWYLGSDEYDFTNPVTEDITLEAKWEVTARLLRQNTVSLKDNLTLNFFVILDDEDVDDAYVKLHYNHYGEDKTVTVNVDPQNRLYQYYRIPCPLTASEMAIEVTAKLYINNSEQSEDTFTRSIREYCISRMGNSETSDIEKDLLRKALNYGGYTQKYLGNNTDYYAYKDYVDDVSDVEVKSNITTPVPRNETHEGITYIGATLTLVDTPFVRYYFTLNNGNSINDYTFTINGENKTPDNNVNGYYIEADPVFAYELDKQQNIIVKKGNDEAFNFKFSAVKWMESVSVNVNKPDEQKAAKAMYNYYIAAQTYYNRES